MSWSPISVGDASPAHCTFATDSGVFSLTGLSASDLSMHLIDTANSTLSISTGAWTITNAAAGLADWNPTAGDVAVAGLFRCYPVVTLATGPKAFDPQLLDIQNLP